MQRKVRHLPIEVGLAEPVDKRGAQRFISTVCKKRMCRRFKRRCAIHVFRKHPHAPQKSIFAAQREQRVQVARRIGRRFSTQKALPKRCSVLFHAFLAAQIPMTRRSPRTEQSGSPPLFSRRSPAKNSFSTFVGALRPCSSATVSNAPSDRIPRHSGLQHSSCTLPAWMLAIRATPENDAARIAERTFSPS